MSAVVSDTVLPLRPETFASCGEHLVAESAAFTVTAFRYPSSVEGLRIANARGHIVVLPFLGQMIWDAVFDGCRLTMGNVFTYPRHASSILETYGAFVYHAGVLRNGTPGPQDTHPLHGEMPVARMDSAHLRLGQDAQGSFVEVGSQVQYAIGFGPHYVAHPRLRLHANSALIEIEMVVENRATQPMELMYMLHANFNFVADAHIHQATSYTPQHTVVRQAIPGHVTPTPAFLELLEDLAHNPDRMRILAEPQRYSPEQVFYIRGLGCNAEGRTQMVMALPSQDAFSVSYRPQDLPHCVRWILNDGNAQVAAFALPSTCEPEGYSAEKAKGHVRLLAPGEVARFPVTLGYLNATEAHAAIAHINTMKGT